MTSQRCDPHGLVEETTRRMERNMLLGEPGESLGSQAADPRCRMGAARLLAYGAVAAVLLLSVAMVASTLVNPSLLDEAAKYAGVGRSFQKQPPRLAKRKGQGDVANVAKGRRADARGVTPGAHKGSRLAAAVSSSADHLSKPTSPVVAAAANTAAELPTHTSSTQPSAVDIASPLSWFTMEDRMEKLLSEFFADAPSSSRSEGLTISGADQGAPFYWNAVLDRQLPPPPGYVASHLDDSPRRREGAKKSSQKYFVVRGF